MAARVIPLIAAALAALAIWSRVWIWLWPSAVMFAVAFVYIAGKPAAFGKQRDGRQAWWSWIAWAPMFAYMRIAHEAARWLTREPVFDEVAPGILVGRRPGARELPANVAIVVDLCAELGELPGIVAGQRYLAIPTLDATSPTPAELVRAVDEVLAAIAGGGNAFIHCAFGHGRSATVAAAVLVRRGDATLETVEAMMKARRPRIGLNAIQRGALAEANRLAPRSA